MNTFHTDVSVLIGNLFKLERCGRYEEALAEIRDIWGDITTFPCVDDFAPRAAAEIVLRCGALIGFFGHIKQIPNSQERSKNLLTEARNRFLDIYDVEKISECENYISLAYWRSGELVEAETWIEEALLHELPNSNQTRLYSYIIRNLIFFQLKRFEINLSHIKIIEEDFKLFGSDCLKGDFYSYYGLNLRNTGERDLALEKYITARQYYQKAGHQIALGIVENNLANIYKMKGNFAKAHQAIDTSTKIFKQIKDRTREGFSLDTKATLYCEEGNYAEALKIIEKAISILKKSENADYLVETILSKTKILIYLDDFTKAFLCLSDAVQIAKTKISEGKAENLVKEFEIVLKEKHSPVINQTFTEKEIGGEKLELILHPSISHYQDFQGVWIKNSHLEKIGLRKGSLAVVTKDTIKRGDLVAISEIADDSVICGFYDADFGIVCLEGIGEEPRLFNENEIKILGKIVGVGKAEKDANGKIIVEPLNI